jgi:gamma-glutamyltranspeptidase
MSPADAVTCPRFATDHMENSFDSSPDRAEAFKSPGSLQVSEGVGESVREELSDRGHTVSVAEDAIAMPVMLTIDPDGTFHVAGDPEAGRHAGALD